MKRIVWLLPALLAVVTLLLAGAVAAQPPAPSQNIELAYATFDPVTEGEPDIPAAWQAAPDDTLALVQLAGPPTVRLVADLAAAGIHVYDFLPTYTAVARVPTAVRPSLAARPDIRWVGPFQPIYKLSPFLLDTLSASGGAGEVSVELFPDIDKETVVTAVTALGVTLLPATGEHLLRVRVQAEQLPALARLTAVRWLQAAPQLREYNDDARWLTQSNLPGLPTLHDRGLTGAGQVGAVADSGLAVYDFGGPGNSNCFFTDDGVDGTTANPPLPPGPTHRKVITYTTPVGAMGDQVDGSGHGSHVTGSIVGDQPPWNGRSPSDGLAYDSRVFFQDIGLGVLTPTINPPADFRVMFQQAYDANGDAIYQPLLEPRTHSNSYGDPTPIYSIESGQTDDFMWTHPDFLILYAAGNQGPGANSIGWPATAKNIVTVGATENGGANPDNMLFQSSHGPAPINRLKPTLSAPGDRIISALNSAACGTAERSGTSMATPTLQGVAMQMRQYLVDGFYPSGGPQPADTHHPSAALLKALLINSGRPMSGNHSDNAAGGSWPADGQGWGRVLADDALYFAGDHRTLWFHDEYSVDGTTGLDMVDATRTFTFTVGDGAPLRPEGLEMTLVWTDHPGSPVANGSLVNDLHLVVVDPGGGTHRGNEAATNDFNGTPDLPLISPDTVNPWEVVYLAAPQPGVYTATVTLATMGSALIDPGRKQGFALVVTGDLLDRRGRVELDYPRYATEETAVARVRLVDLDLDLNPTAVDTTTVLITSTSDLIGQTIVLTETAVGGVFAGDITLRRGAPLAGELTVAAGDVVRAHYVDQNSGLAPAVNTGATAVVAPPPPSRSNPPPLNDPGPDVTDGNFTVSWSAAEVTAGLDGYRLQEATDYVQPLLDDAEGSIGTLWTTGQINAPWTQSPTYAQSPMNGYWSGRGDVMFLVDTSLTLKQAVLLPATLDSARLTFYSRFHNDFNDQGLVQIMAGGGSWETLLRLYADPRVPPANGRLQHHEIDLGAYIGQAIKLRFRYENGVLSFPPDSPGWWIDDINVDGAAWRTVSEVPANQLSVNFTGRPPGTYRYRVQGQYDDGSVTGWSNVDGLTVLSPTAVGPQPAGVLPANVWPLWFAAGLGLLTTAVITTRVGRRFLIANRR